MDAQKKKQKERDRKVYTGRKILNSLYTLWNMKGATKESNEEPAEAGS